VPVAISTTTAEPNPALVHTTPASWRRIRSGSFLLHLSDELRRAAHAVETKRGSNNKTRVVAVVVHRRRRRCPIEAHQFRDGNVRWRPLERSAPSNIERALATSKTTRRYCPCPGRRHTRAGPVAVAGKAIGFRLFGAKRQEVTRRLLMVAREPVQTGAINILCHRGKLVPWRHISSFFGQRRHEKRRDSNFVTGQTSSL